MKRKLMLIGGFVFVSFFLMIVVLCDSKIIKFEVLEKDVKEFVKIKEIKIEIE